MMVRRYGGPVSESAHLRDAESVVIEAMLHSSDLGRCLLTGGEWNYPVVHQLSFRYQRR
jgi:hypothetical protein